MPADASSEVENRVLSPGSLMSLYDEKRRSRWRPRENEVIVKKGTLDTSSGVTLTSETAREAKKEEREEGLLKRLTSQRSLRRARARPLALRREVAKARSAARRQKLHGVLNADRKI